MRKRACACLVVVVGFACASLEPPPAPPPGWRTTLATAPPAPRENAFPLPPEELEVLMRSVDLRVVEIESTGAGIAGAQRMVARYPQRGRTLAFKWKTAPGGGDGWNNSPRREIAAYRVQEWYLDSHDFVVPTTTAVCIPADRFPEDFEAEPSFDATGCLFGTQAVWLEGVHVPEQLFDPERFYRDSRYAMHLAHYNLLTFLIQNRDTRAGNYLASEDESNRRIYAVDNGISFGEWFFNFFVLHWDEIRVPALPRRAIDRLRGVRESDLEALGVVAEFRRDADGQLREVPPSPVIDADSGVRIRGDVIQLGLRSEEIDGVRDRLRDLLSAVERGEILVY